MNRDDLMPLLRTLGSAGIAVLGFAVLVASWPDSHAPRPLPTEAPWTSPGGGGWLAVEDDRTARPDDPPRLRPQDPRPNADDPRRDPVDLPPSGTRPYVVERGDNLWKIAERVLGRGHEHPQLVELNPQLAHRPLLAGETILVPVPAGASRRIPVDPRDPGPVDAVPRVRDHVVKDGEVLSRIALRYDTTVDAILVANAPKVSSADRIRVGQVLKIPVGGGSAR